MRESQIAPLLRALQHRHRVGHGLAGDRANPWPALERLRPARGFGPRIDVAGKRRLVEQRIEHVDQIRDCDRLRLGPRLEQDIESPGAVFDRELCVDAIEQPHASNCTKRPGAL